jgi:hypothetical protein
LFKQSSKFRQEIEFKGKAGNLHFACRIKNGQDCFAFTLCENEAFANNKTVRRMNEERHSEKVVVVAKNLIRFEASADSFSKIREQFTNSQSQKGETINCFA